MKSMFGRKKNKERFRALDDDAGADSATPLAPAAAAAASSSSSSPSKRTSKCSAGSAYWDADGVLRMSTHDPAAQLRRVTALDSGDKPMGDVWHVISTRWLKSWLEYAHAGKRGPPNMIDNACLLDGGAGGGGGGGGGGGTGGGAGFRPGLRVKKHFRLVNTPTWVALHGWYKGGPAITVPASVDMGDVDLLRDGAVVGGSGSEHRRQQLHRESLAQAAAVDAAAAAKRAGNAAPRGSLTSVPAGSQSAAARGSPPVAQTGGRSPVRSSAAAVDLLAGLEDESGARVTGADAAVVLAAAAAQEDGARAGTKPGDLIDL
jgi:hypothetical protein